ncbi:member of Set1p complex, histone methyl transferase, partial [Perkinsus chesapeaki]
MPSTAEAGSGPSTSIAWSEQDIDNLDLAFVYKDNDRPVTSMDFSASGRYLATCSSDQTVRIYDTNTLNN